ncbi:MULTISPECIES: hypothetical protein [Luteimonas]|uniref:hypothetical protein n=1 Tax=Luteimonas TaxID=83614 RepID=UPI001E3E1782|nr:MULTISPECIES: hypothetical protein [Luteimonas]
MGDQAVEHGCGPRNGSGAIGRFVRVPPLGALEHLGVAAVIARLDTRRDDAAPDVGPADVDREECVVAMRTGRRQRHPAEQAGIVAIVAQRGEIDAGPRQLQQTTGAAHRERARAAARKATADDDALDAVPLRLREETPDDVRQPLRMVFDRGVDEVRGVGIAADQDEIDVLLGNRLGRRAAEGIPIVAEGWRRRASSRARNAVWLARSPMKPSPSGFRSARLQLSMRRPGRWVAACRWRLSRARVMGGRCRAMAGIVARDGDRRRDGG